MESKGERAQGTGEGGGAGLGQSREWGGRQSAAGEEGSNFLGYRNSCCLLLKNGDFQEGPFTGNTSTPETLAFFEKWIWLASF